MLHTPVCDLLRIRHPVVLSGMAGGHMSVTLAAAVSLRAAVEGPRSLREATPLPFGVNFLLFDARAPAIEAALKERPPAESRMADRHRGGMERRRGAAICNLTTAVWKVLEALPGRPGSRGVISSTIRGKRGRASCRHQPGDDALPVPVKRDDTLSGIKVFRLPLRPRSTI